MKLDDTDLDLDLDLPLDAPLLESEDDWMARVMESEHTAQEFDPVSTACPVDRLWPGR